MQFPQHLIFQTNHDNRTPDDSCSAVAALVAGATFATTNGVPGGNNEQTGKPSLESQTAYNVFVMASLVALCFSVTALVMFHSLQTSRQQLKDFRTKLPLKILLCLSSLLVSTVSMSISFCAAQSFVLKEKLSKLAYVIYVATSLPVSLYAVAQLPLLFNLLKAIITKVSQPVYKFLFPSPIARLVALMAKLANQPWKADLLSRYLLLPLNLVAHCFSVAAFVMLSSTAKGFSKRLAV